MLGAKPLPSPSLEVIEVFGGLLFISSTNRKQHVVGGVISGCDHAIKEGLTVELYLYSIRKL